MRFRDVLITSLESLTKELGVVFKDITFSDNFTSFTVTAVIPATSELRIRNELNIIPSTMVIKKQTGNGLITASTTVWTKTYLYIYNHGAAEVTADIVFMR